MSEAYEIGVTLALGDGVSVGIAQARKDVAQLERVLVAGGVSVQQLRAASVAALSVVKAVSKVEKTAAKEPASARPEDTALAATRMEAVQAPPATLPKSLPASGPPAPAERTASAPWRMVEYAAAEKNETNGSAPSAEASAPAAQVVLAPRADPQAPFSQPAQTGGPAIVMQVSAPVSLATIGAAARDLRPQPVSGGTEPPRAFAGAEIEAPPARALDVPPPDPAGVPAAGGRQQAPLAQAAWMPQGGNDGAGGRAQASAEPLPPAAAPAGAPVAPQSDTGGAAVPQAPAAPPSSMANSGPTEGDVFLDGALVGRWISRFLSQEAGRASAGPTGFDPRRGRLLPGATVGG